MLSPDERNLLVGVLLLLLLGAAVNACRHRVVVDQVPPEDLPGVESIEGSRTSPD
jgi:hypothetical protein